jgi:hypothetical protein
MPLRIHEKQDLPPLHGVVRPAIYFADLPFQHSRSVVSVMTSTAINTTSNDGPSR